MSFRAIEWLDETNTLKLIDQTKLPGEVKYLLLTDTAQIEEAIKTLTVRGAPAIGVAAAFGILQQARKGEGDDIETLKGDLANCDAILRASRPTAVNLFWALDKMQRVWADAPNCDGLPEALRAKAYEIEKNDIAVNQAISRHAMDVVPDKATFFHHCNTGSLATVDLGTALGIIRTAHEAGKDVFAYLDETRPRLQGAKLSSFELMEFGVPHAIVVDGASAHIMRKKHVDLVVVGCDRVAANGDTANKIGTYNLALAAQDNDVPFYVAAPTSTIDMLTLKGDDIEIEERDGDEITNIDGVNVAPPGAPTFNPAFDVTPNRLITGIITEFGIVEQPFEENLRALLKS